MQGIISEALKQTLMYCQLMCTLPLPWIWVVEALARSNQVDVSLLLGLLEKTPEISNDLGKNSREMVSLRILESFLVQGARVKSVSSPRSPKIRLDPSESCEDVLRRILSEVSASNLKDAAPEMWKWDIRPFVEHKRSKLSKFALQELKDAILTGSHSFPASLKEKSGLSVGNQPEHGAPMDDVNLRDTTPRVEGADAILMHIDPPVENVPVSRKRRITTENSAGGGALDLTNKDKQEGKSTRQVSQSPRVHGKHQKTARAARKSRGGLSEKRSESRSNKGVLCPPEKDLPHQSKCSTSTKTADAEKVSEEEKELRVVSSTHPAIPHLSRKNLPWTREAEEKLEEAVEKIWNLRPVFLAMEAMARLQNDKGSSG